MIRLIRELVRPYRGSLLVILLAMLVETAASLATPWPLKIIIDNVVGHHKMTPWLADLFGPWMDGKHQLHIAAVVAVAYVVIALLGALATYIDNYYTESVGQYVANDLRLRTFHHLQRLSLGYYSTHQTGTFAQHDYDRHPDNPGLRFVVDVEHPGRFADHRLHVGADVLAQLGLHA